MERLKSRQMNCFRKKMAELCFERKDIEMQVNCGKELFRGSGVYRSEAQGERSIGVPWRACE